MPKLCTPVYAPLQVEALVQAQLQAHFDLGPHQRIKQLDLRVFWKQRFSVANMAEVPWDEWWEDFPHGLKENPADPDAVDQLAALLADRAAREAFKRRVERSNQDSLSVFELGRAFGEGDLASQVRELLGGAADGGAASGTESSASAVPGAEVGVCRLPELPAQYTGREAEAEDYASRLAQHGWLALLAPGGMGKSCLAADVGWRLHRAGKLPGGALWLDLREATSAADVEGRFCTALGIDQVGCSCSWSPRRMYEHVAACRFCRQGACTRSERAPASCLAGQGGQRPAHCDGGSGAEPW
jgi:hypothetical protein